MRGTLCVSLMSPPTSPIVKVGFSGTRRARRARQDDSVTIRLLHVWPKRRRDRASPFQSSGNRCTADGMMDTI